MDGPTRPCGGDSCEDRASVHVLGIEGERAGGREYQALAAEGAESLAAPGVALARATGFKVQRAHTCRIAGCVFLSRPSSGWTNVRSPCGRRGRERKCAPLKDLRPSCQGWNAHPRTMARRVVEARGPSPRRLLRNRRGSDVGDLRELLLGSGCHAASRCDNTHADHEETSVRARLAGW